MVNELVTVERVAAVGRIELNRADVSNAIDLPTAHALGAAVDTVAADPEVRAVVLTGAGPRFCVGGDVASMAAAEDQASYVHELAEAIDGTLQRLAALEKPVVIGVHGAVAGGGMALMLSGDLVVAGASTRFVTAYAGVGLTPDCGLSWLLPRAVGHQRAAELCLTGRVLTAADAEVWGMVTRVTDDRAVVADAVALGEQLAAGPAYAFGQAHRLLHNAWTFSRGEAGAEESRTISQAVTTPDAQQRINAFLKH
ncbi:enoyl-CoA hydratase/isomerase family protein [Nocardioides sp.]|uniref:enoyl-CoA hydratase/isomerase family protein n=1 Tax=Nocardioides sp. TaxID=35761 RepID=UPI002732751D|nr:enoyl-CoA hydratase/isomerase family protein [Nocardioides sp.]MDP3892172.1 enoyl-CoA hydratase/isomerase family protein [Nocardioides sp.]